MGSKKIKVIHIITMLELGGAQETTLYTLAHLDKSRYIPVLICGPGGPLLPEARKIRDIRLYICDQLIRPVAPMYDIRAIKAVRTILCNERRSHEGPVIVHTHSSKAGIVGRCASFLAAIPLCLHTVHGFGFNPYQSLFVKWAFITAERLTGFFTTKMIYVSRDNLELGIKLGVSRPENSLIIRSGIDWDAFSNKSVDRGRIRKEFGIPKDAKIVGMVACFKPQKAPLDFIAMAGRIKRQLPDTHFIMVGDGALRPQIEDMIDCSGLKGNIHLTGWRRDIPDILSDLDLLVLTSLWEGLPKVVLEAQLMGVPVVATKTSGIGEVIRDGVSGFITPPKRPDIMAYKVLTVLKDPKISAQMGRNARYISKEFDLRETLIKHEELYEGLIAKK